MALSFRLGRIPVRISPSFFVMAVILRGLTEPDLQVIIAWVVIVLASVLLHELGHATMGLAFGLEPAIVLHGMGGTTSWPGAAKLTTARRVAVSLAGPGAGFAAGGLVVIAHLVLGPHFFPPTRLGETIYHDLLWVNVGWGVLNLLPMLPLDGGNVMAQLLNATTGGRGERPARLVSIGLAALAAAWALRQQSWWSALLAVSFLSTNWRGLKDAAARERDAPMRAALDQAYEALDAKDGARVLELARPVALGARTAAIRAEGLQLMAFGFLLEGRVADADAAVAALPPGYAPHPSLLKLRADAGR